jgi:acid phosphatase family membrane protein YuiD
MQNQVLIAGAIALFAAQGLKIVTNMAKERRFNFRVVVGTGGMPSSHTALVMAVSTTLGLTEGFGSPLFDTALVFSSIVMYDATGVRQAAGKQAAILNKMMDEFSATHTFTEQRLKELLGHTRLEVLGGALFGVMVAMLLHYGW